MADHTFCRLSLRTVMEDVRRNVAPEDIKKSWAYMYGTDSGEFHGPNEFYWVGGHHCKANTKAMGWSAYLNKIGIEGY